MRWANKIKDHYDIVNSSDRDLSVTKNVNYQRQWFFNVLCRVMFDFLRRKKPLEGVIFRN